MIVQLVILYNLNIEQKGGMAIGKYHLCCNYFVLGFSFFHD